MKHKLVVEVYTDGCTRYEKIQIACFKPEICKQRETGRGWEKRRYSLCGGYYTHNAEFFGNEEIGKEFYAVD
jgi:hypothetical protein